VEANELRIGNLVKWEDESNDIVIVSSIINGDTDAEATICYDELVTNECGEVYLFEFKPILLTEEWFVKFGFEKENDVFKKARFEIYRPVSYVGYLFCEGNLIIRELKYVHTLQNLYFALTGEELTIKK
jgi:hypothetical protein